MPLISIGAVIFISQQHFAAPFLNLMPLLHSLVPRACKQGIKSKAGAIKCCKEIKITAPPIEQHNILLRFVRSPHLTSTYIMPQTSQPLNLALTTGNTMLDKSFKNWFSYLCFYLLQLKYLLMKCSCLAVQIFTFTLSQVNNFIEI